MSEASMVQKVVYTSAGVYTDGVFSFYGGDHFLYSASSYPIKKLEVVDKNRGRTFAARLFGLAAVEGFKSALGVSYHTKPDLFVLK